MTPPEPLVDPWPDLDGDPVTPPEPRPLTAEALAYIVREHGQTFLDDDAWQRVYAIFGDATLSPREIELRLLDEARALPSTPTEETEPCPTCMQPVPVPQRGDHDYGLPLVASTPTDQREDCELYGCEHAEHHPSTPTDLHESWCSRDHSVADACEEGPPALVLVREGSGGVFPDGTTNHPSIDFDAALAATPAEVQRPLEPEPDGATLAEPAEPADGLDARDDACRHGYMTGTFCSECPNDVATLAEEHERA